MSGEENIKMAINHLQKAAAEKGREAKDMSTELDRQRKDLEKDIDRLKTDIQRHDAIVADSKQSEAIRVVAAKAIPTLKSEIQERQQQISQAHDTMKSSVQALEDQSRMLDEQAKALNNFR
jgi:hypothetical protein